MVQQLQGAKGAPVRAVGSPGFLRPMASSGRRTTSLLLLSPHSVPPVRIRSPPSDSHPVAPLETTVTVWLLY
jgi:hypothetical protein